ncbi:hypothetical protein [Micromonospora tulbaghiae]|uniref:hypothetical protein n=1 Tax=Micromonospora tulbaghiae TaxID=479978 RepID=UPI003EB69ED5
MTDNAKFFEGHPEYAGRLLCVALCQGAGLHFVDVARGEAKPTGVKDLDVWSFFAALPGRRFPADRRDSHIDFGPSSFGRWSRELPKFRHFQGRRVDLFMRALPVDVGTEPAAALRGYLRAGRTESARRLAVKGVVLIAPGDRRGEIVWPR